MKSVSTNASVSNIITGSPSYSGGGSYTLNGLVVGSNYLWTKGASDTGCVVNGSITLTATGVFTATATSVTLNGTNSAAITAMVSLMIPVNLFQSTFTPALPARLVTVGEFPIGNPNWSRQHQISDQAHFCKRGTVGVSMLISDFSTIALALEVGLTWTPPVILVQPSNATCAATAAASGTLTGSGSTNVTDGDTVTLGTQTYRFKNTMAAINDVQIGGSGNSDTSLLSFIRAINGTGTPGTDYFTGTTANTSVMAAVSITSHAFAVTARVSGLAGNSIVTTETSSVLSFGGGTLSGGTSGAANFVVSAGSEYAITYQWQYSPDMNNWTNATGTVNGCAYSGGTTATLICTPTTNGQNGYFHRCIVTDDAGLFGLTNGSINTDGKETLTIQ